MPSYIFAYHGGKEPETPEAGAEMMSRWQAWLGDLGDAMVNPGTPVGKSWTVSSAGVAEDGGANPLMGYSIVQADGMEGALGMAKACPYLAIGTIEVAELKQM